MSTEVVFVMDTSTSMTYGTRWSDEPDPVDFRYEPWESALYRGFALDAVRMGAYATWVPMGNEPDHSIPFRGFPFSVFRMVMDFIYYPNMVDRHEFGMLPGIVAREIINKVNGQ